MTTTCEQTSRGRPSKLTPETASAVLALVRVGHYLSVAAGAAGVGHSTVRRWIQLGRKHGREFEPYREFRAAYRKARAEARKGLEGCVLRAGIDDPDLALKVLERLHPEDWGTHKNEIKRLRKAVEELLALRGAV